MTFEFKKAVRFNERARVALDGPTGAGKTWDALVLATALAKGGKIAVIDSEHGSAALYSDRFDFDHLDLSRDTGWKQRGTDGPYDPRNYIAAIELAGKLGYAVIVIDSLSHAWEAEGGSLDQVDKKAARSNTGNTFVGWRDVRPLERQLLNAMLSSPAHIIGTMRTKMEYVLEKDERTGKQVPVKKGLSPVQKAGLEYEFQVVADIDIEHNLKISKSRCIDIYDAVVNKPTVEWWKPYVDWLESGAVDDRPVVEQPVTVAGVEQGKATTPPPPPPSNPRPTPPPAKPLERPMTPDKLVEIIDRKAMTIKELAPVKKRNAFKALLEQLVPDEEDRKSFCAFVFGAANVDAMTHGMVLAGLAWGSGENDTPNEYATQEVQAVLGYINTLKGVTEGVPE